MIGRGAWQNSSRFYSNELGDAPDVRDEARGPFFRQVLLSRKHSRRRNTFCTCFFKRTVFNIEHVACQWRGTAFSGRRPLPTLTGACSRTLLLASDAVALFRHHWAHATLGLGHWNCGCNLGWGPARCVNPQRRHPDCSIQTRTQK